MPTYEYRCTKCKEKFEEFQSITADPLDQCPSCGGQAIRIISGGAGLLFKGDGFYITDYRSEGYKKDAKKDSSSSGSDTKGDSKSKSDTSSKSESKSKTDSTSKKSGSDKKK